VSWLETNSISGPPAVTLFSSSVRFEYWKSSIDRLWYWHLKTVRNEKLAQGEAYPTKAECLQAIDQVRQCAAASVHNLSPREK
jgi:uncharacterized protein YegP (UPF0339 family)